MTQRNDQTVAQEPSEWYVKEVVLSYGPRCLETDQLSLMRAPEHIVAACRDMKHMVTEQFRVLLLDVRHHLIGWKMVSQGTLTASLVHPREVLMPALLVGAASMVLVHNHPSGLADPSQEDKSITRRLKSCAKLIGIPILDHVIIGHPGWSSAQKEGWL